MNALMELPLPEGDRKVMWRAVKVGRMQVLPGFLLLPDGTCLLTTCSSDESEKKFLLIENFELAMMRPHLEIHYMSLLSLYISPSI